MRTTVVIVSCLLGLCQSLRAADVPIRRVVLFSSGVGYFERSGTVRDNDSVELQFRAEQINDMLKSLVLEDLGGGTVGVVTYPAREPIERALKSFAVDITNATTFGQLLSQLRGITVEVAAAETFRGPIVSVEPQKRQVGPDEASIVQVDVLTVLTDSGLRSAALPDVRHIRVLDERIDGELRKALEALAASRDAETKQVTLRFAGQGERRVRAGYIIETPVWKTSYRLVLGQEDKALLQGWAIVENMTDQDWNEVQLSLVSGRPISFVQDLYEPLYLPRPEVKPELYAGLRPQMYERAMKESQLGEVVAGGAEAKAEAETRLQRGRELRRFGAAAMAPAPAADALAARGVQEMAVGREAGELFSYNASVPVSIPRHRSAMLPIVNQPIQAEKVSIYNPDVQPKHPLHGLALTNNTELHLLQGPVTVFDDNTYAGDARLDDLGPGQKGLVSYALDLKCIGEVQRTPRPEEVVSLRIAKGTLILQRKQVDERTYQIKNDDQKQRIILIEQPFDPQWKLAEPNAPFERTTQEYRFRVEVKPGATAKLPVRLERQVQERVVLAEAGLDTIELYLQSRQISDRLKEALQTVVQKRQQIGQTERQLQDLEGRLAEIEKEQDRLRRNLQAVPAQSELSARYHQKLAEQEDQIEQLQKQIEAARQQLRQQQKDLETYLLSLEVQ